MSEPSFKSKRFHQFMQHGNIRQKYVAPNGDVFTKKFQTQVNGEKYVVLKWETKRDVSDVIVRPKQGSVNHMEYEVIYRKWANYPRPSYNKYPFHEDNGPDIDPGNEEDRKSIQIVNERGRSLRKIR